MKDQPFLFPLLGITSGILLGQFLPESNWRFLELIILTLIIFILIFKSKFYFLGSLSILLFFTFFGIIRFHHFNSNEKLNQNLLSEKKWVKLKIENQYRSSEKFKKYKAEILSVDSIIPQKNNLLLYWKKDNPNVFPDDEIWIFTKIQKTEPPKNPHQFDYQKYLAKQRIHYTAYSDTVFRIEKYGNSWQNKTVRFKTEIRKELLKYGYSKSATDIIGAMLLGDRTEMDKEVEESYRKTGVVHILSISGLHVVMVYSIFYFLFYPLINLRRGKLLRIIFSLLFIWAYACFVELQPPVARSALMITIFHLALVFRRKPNIYHTLLLSSFLLLVINPNFLFDVGFQLSYAAVFFIVWLMPVYRKLWPAKNRKLKYIRDFTGTSISAQAGTFPISAYYFHQTSGLFLAGNMFMIPVSFLMIIGGFFSVILTVLKIEFKEWVWAYNCLFHLSNKYISWLSSHSNFVAENISLNIFQVLILIAILAGIRHLFSQFSFKSIVFTLSLLLIFELSRMQRIHYFNRKEELIVFHQYKNSVIGIRNGSNLDLFISNLNDSLKLNQYVIEPYSINEGIDSINYFKMDAVRNSGYIKTQNIILWNGERFLIINQDSGTKLPSFDYILVQNSAEINLSSVQEKTQIIIDGSNFPNHLKETGNKIWFTKENGAKIFTQP